MLRKAAVSGMFYPSSKGEIISFFEKISPAEDAGEAGAAFVPHAGYPFSGETAYKTLASIKIPDRVIMMGPNHTGLGDAAGIYPEGAFRTPLGDCPVDGALVMDLCDNPIFSRDTLSHLKEHSLEVIIPMLQHLNPDVSIAPVLFKHQSLENVRSAAQTVAKAAEQHDALILVSTDFNHFESAEVTDRKDEIAISAILEMDEEKLLNQVRQNDISMCGVYPSAVAVAASKNIGLNSPTLIEHTHSGYASGDFDRCVGYAGIIIK